MGNNQSQDDNITITRNDSPASTKPIPSNSNTNKGSSNLISATNSKHTLSNNTLSTTQGRKTAKQDSKIELKNEVANIPPRKNAAESSPQQQQQQQQQKRYYNTTRAGRSALFESRPSISSLFPDGASTHLQIIDNKESRERMDAVLRASGKFDIANLSNEELEWRPRSNSVAVPFFSAQQSLPKVDFVVRDRSNSVAIAALKRASLRIENNMKARMLKRETSILSRQERAAIKIQSSFRRWIAVKKYKKQLQRMNVVREILITELDYVRFLSVLVKVYFYPLRKSKILSADEITAIFPQVEIIKIYNTKFAEQLQSKMREWSCYQTIGDAFVSMVDFLREPYAIYISQFPDITERINICSRRPAVAVFLKKCTKFTEVASMDLLSLVSMPFQRIPRYMLLLKECLKFTEPTHRDYELIRIAIKKLDSLTQSASERLRMEEGSKSVARISASLQPPVQNLVRPYRKLIRDSSIDAKFVAINEKEKDCTMEKNCQIFLFNDCVLIAKQHKKTFFESNSLDLKLKPITVMDLRGAVVLDSPQSNEFKLGAKEGIAILQTKNWPEKEAWKSDLSDTIDSLVDSSDLSSSSSFFLSSPSSYSSRSTLSRSMSIRATPVSQPTKMVKSKSQFTPGQSTNTPGITKSGKQRLTRQFTLPQLAEIFIHQKNEKFAAPKVEVTPRRVNRVGRAASYNSFFIVHGSTQRKKRMASVKTELAKELCKSRSMPEILRVGQ